MTGKFEEVFALWIYCLQLIKACLAEEDIELMEKFGYL